MELKLERPLLFFDLETTGINVTHDRIVEISIVKVFPGKSEPLVITRRVNPGIPIPPSATAVHHISDADVANEPTFKEIAESIKELFTDSDVAGFNSNKFDMPLLIEEFTRAGITFNTAEISFIDVQVLYHKLEQRTLSAAYKFYCQKELENAHSAMADTYATFEVLKAMLSRYDNLENDVKFLSEMSDNGALDLSARIVRNAEGVVVFNFGKHKNVPVTEVFRKDPSFYTWIMQSDFPKNTKDVLTGLRGEWLRNTRK